jgi:hypothetical protein
MTAGENASLKETSEMKTGRHWQMKNEKSGPEVSVEADEEMVKGVIPLEGLHALLIYTLNGQPRPFRTRLMVPGLGLKPTVERPGRL